VARAENIQRNRLDLLDPAPLLPSPVVQGMNDNILFKAGSRKLLIALSVIALLFSYINMADRTHTDSPAPIFKYSTEATYFLPDTPPTDGKTFDYVGIVSTESYFWYQVNVMLTQSA
jgi:hypothetical protein